VVIVFMHKYCTRMDFALNFGEKVKNF